MLFNLVGGGSDGTIGIVRLKKGIWCSAFCLFDFQGACSAFYLRSSLMPRR